MSWWRQLLGLSDGLPDRARGPDVAVDGVLRGGKKQGLWIEKEGYDGQLAEVLYRDDVREGPYRFWDREGGWMRERGTFVSGKKHGTVETFTETGVRRTLAEMKDGRFEGRYQRFLDDGSLDFERAYRGGEVWSGPDDSFTADGVALRRARREGGVLVGSVEENDSKGRPRLRQHYGPEGKLDGPYSAHHEGGAVSLEGQYQAGERVGVWRWRRIDGSLAAESDGAEWRSIDRQGQPGPRFSPRDDADLARWVALADAWSELGGPNGHWFRNEHAVDAWPEDDRARPLAWLRERIAERQPSPRRTTYGMGWIQHLVGKDDDPRARLFDGIVLDHHHWGPESVARVVRRADTLRELSLYECRVEPEVSALFPPGVAWPLLERLYIDGCGPLGSIPEVIASASWASALVVLDLGSDDGIPVADAARILGSKHFTSLRRLRLANLGLSGDLAAAISEAASLLARLEHLQLETYGDTTSLVAAVGACDMPELTDLRLEAPGDEVRLPEASLLALIDVARKPKLARVELEGIRVQNGLIERLSRERPGLVLCG